MNMKFDGRQLRRIHIFSFAHNVQQTIHTQCMAKGDDRYDQEGEQTNVKQTRNVFNNRIENSKFVI